MKKIISTIFCILSASVLSLAQVSEFKILPSDGDAYEQFGSSVSNSGDYCIVGAGTDDDSGYWSGSVYIFKKNGTDWIEVQKIIASDGDSLDVFGSSVSISGDYLIVGASGDDDNGSASGSAYIFRRDDLVWVEEQKILASDGAVSDLFGISVSISGDYAIVGVPNDDDNGSASGSAYIFRRDDSVWVEEQKLIASDGTVGDSFGDAVSISGNFALVGADWDDDNGLSSGSAYLFKRNGSNWIEEQKFIASDAAEWDHFGRSVSISEDFALIGARGRYSNALSTGSAYLFKKDSPIWIEEQKLIPSDGEIGDKFGSSVSIREDFALIGAFQKNNYTGAAYIFKRTDTTWSELQKLTASDGTENNRFGSSVSISGDYVIIGSPLSDDNGIWSGSAYIYTDFVAGTEDELNQLPLIFGLNQNYPNPFNPTTKIKFSLPSSGYASLKIYNALGEEVAALLDKELKTGTYEVEWNATGFSSGVYFYQLRTDGFVETKKMILMK